MRLILSICTILLLFINISSSEMITKPKHHLPDGTFSNPSGKINSKNFAEMFKWGWERKDPIEVYLSNSVDLVDLEQRQKRITYGTINPNLRGWV